MEILADMHKKAKSSTLLDASRKLVCLLKIHEYNYLTSKKVLESIRSKSRSLVMFAGMLRFRMLPDVYSYLARLDVEISL